MPNYEYRCDDCHHFMEDIRQVKDRDLLKKCPHCQAGWYFRVFETAPEVRTAKTSATYVSGINKRKDGYEDLKAAAQLEVDKLKHRPNSEEYKAIDNEIKIRKDIVRNGGKYEK